MANDTEIRCIEVLRISVRAYCPVPEAASALLALGASRWFASMQDMAQALS